jgi:hypothetical protein
MDSHEISLVPVALDQDRMRHGFGSGGNWTGILLNSPPVCSQEKDISLWYLQDVGDMPVWSSRVVKNFNHSLAPFKKILAKIRI